jgi:hypothetical protein
MRRLSGLLTGFALATSVLAPLSCSAPGKGALILAISTDMQTPKDVDVISVYVETDSQPKFDYLARVLPDGSVSLPSTLAVVEPDKLGAQVRIRVIAFQEQKARVLRDVLTTVPHQRTSLLRLPLDFLDDGSVTGTLPVQYLPVSPTHPNGAPDGDTLFQPADPVPTDPGYMQARCDFTMQQTSIGGQCQDMHVDSSTLPEYTDALVYGDGGSMLSPACFDVPTCFAGAVAVQVTMSGAGCSFPLPQKANASNLNVALATQGTGTPVGGQNLVPLESDTGEGFTVQGQTVTLVPGVCTKLQSAGTSLVVATSGACAAKTEATPVCEPNSTLDAGMVTADSGSSDSSTPPDASNNGDGAAIDDAGAMDSSVGCAGGLVLCAGVCAVSCPGADSGSGSDAGTMCNGGTGALAEGASCGATFDPDAGPPACGGQCASHLCAPDSTGAMVCQTPTGCHPSGDSCTVDADCCGSASNVDGGTVTCSFTSGCGICSQSAGCRPAGEWCKVMTASCAAPANCCTGTTCTLDNLGLPRCAATTCVAAGGACASSADCCAGSPCIPTGSGNVCFASSCVPSGQPCSTSADCCLGTSCSLNVCTPGPGCGLYGQACAMPQDCCNGVPCTNNRCVSPVY